MNEFDKLSKILLEGDFSADELEIMEEKLLALDLEGILNCHKNAGTHKLEYEFMSEYRCSACGIQILSATAESNGEYEYWSEKYTDYVNVQGETWAIVEYPELPTCKDELMSKVMG